MASCTTPPYSTLGLGCKPNPAKGIFDCSDPTLTGNCCLSAQTTDKTKSNCPAGWFSDPKKSTEWCTEIPGVVSSTYRHKCSRRCSNPLWDPASNCTKCLNGLAFPNCTACANPLFAPPKCTACSNSLLDPKSGCTKCLSNPLFAPPTCGTCANPLFAACTSCDNPLLDPQSGCTKCLSNPLLAPPTCTACANQLYAAPTCTACFNSDLDPTSGCTTCLNGFAPPSCKGCADPRHAGEKCDKCFNSLFEYPDCIACAISEQDITDNCESCTNPELRYPECVECKTNPLLAPQECTECLDRDRTAASGCTKCREGMYLDPKTDTCTLCGAVCGKEGCGVCAQGNCVNNYCNCIDTSAPLATNRKTDGVTWTIGLHPNNMAFVYAPMQMFETSAPQISIGGKYLFYNLGFWGFIQISGHQIIACEVVDHVNYNMVPSSSDISIGISSVARGGLGIRAAGVKGTPGYKNAMQISDSLFNTPKGLALDKTTDKLTGKYTRPTLFVADSGNHCIRMISVTVSGANGKTANPGPLPVTIGVSTLTGSNWKGYNFNKNQALESIPGYRDGDFSQALFDNPTGLDFDSKGVLYVADTNNNAIRRIVIDQATVNLQTTRPYLDYTGTVSTLRIDSEPSEPPLYKPIGVLFHKDYLYVCDHSTIRKIDVLYTGVSKIIAKGLNQPFGMVFKGTNLLFSDADGVKIMVNAGPIIRPAPFASFRNRPLAMMEYRGNIVVGLEKAEAVQISGNQNCTCFPDIAGNCA